MGVSLKVRHRANWPAVRMIMLTWFDHLEEVFLIRRLSCWKCKIWNPREDQLMEETSVYVEDLPLPDQAEYMTRWRMWVWNRCCDVRHSTSSKVIDIWLGYIGCTRYNILVLLSIVFVPNADHYVPTGQAIYIFSFRAYLYASFLYAVSLFLK